MKIFKLLCSVKMKRILLFLSVLAVHVSANTCRVELNYNQRYGYGNIITCDRTDFDEFSKIIVNSEIIISLANSDVSLTPTLFRNLVKIKELNITGSKLRYTNESSFSALANLEVLSLNGDRLEVFPKRLLFGLEKLRELNLRNNSLSELEEGTLRSLYYIKAVNFSLNKVDRVEALHLCEVSASLERLDLSGNDIAVLSKDSIKCLGNLQELNLSRNKLKELNELVSAFLVNLDLSFNLLTRLYFLNATKLVKLNLQGNRIARIDAQNLAELPSLGTLSLGNNSIEFFDPRSLETNIQLRELRLDCNKLSWVDVRVKSVKKLSLKGNVLSKIATANFSSLTVLEQLDLSDNRIESIEQGAFAKIHSLRKLKLHDNSLKTPQLSFEKKALLSDLDLSGNKLVALEQTTFANLGNLQRLDLSFNQLSTLNASLFQSLDNLETLNISYNSLSGVEYDALDPLENLRVLDVEGNKLTSIDYSMIISQLPSLETINVKNNLLSCEFLGKMIGYFRKNEIKFTVNEKFQYDKENVAGIYCKETENRLLSLQEAKEAILNNSRLLNELYSISNHHESGGIGVIGAVFLSLTMLGCVLLVTVVAYKYHAWTKQKQYLIDELELIGNEPYRTFENNKS